MPSINLRKRPRDTEPADTGSDVDVAEPAVSDGRTTAKKGRPTPKRSDARAARPAQGTFGTAITKETRQRGRSERNRAVREAREAMRSGDISKMPARERAPERVLARDLVDGRRNLGTFFWMLIILFYIGSFIPNNTAHSVILYVMVVGLLAVFADCWYVAQKVGRAVAERYPDSRVKVKMYAAQRAVSPRWMRMPKARVSPRDRS
jgi:hypothetical protein